MPINNITQTISELPAAGRRGVDVQTIFVTKQEDFQDHLQGTTVTELNTFKNQLNLRIGEINSTATTMNGYANTASAGASTATTKAGEASTSASGALTSRNQANTFATNSSNSATKSSQWADNDYNVAVETGRYSAKHWSVVAENVVAEIPRLAVAIDSATGSAAIPAGTTAERTAVPVPGMVRFNTELNRLEMYDLDNWREVGGGQLLGTTDEKAIGYLAQSTGEELVVNAGTNAFSVDSIIVEDGGSITVEDDAVYKVL